MYIFCRKSFSCKTWTTHFLHNFYSSLNFEYRREQVSIPVIIALVGKYTKLEDAYASVTKSLRHSALAVERKLVLKVIGNNN